MDIGAGKPLCDKKEYRHVRLASGLEVIIISSLNMQNNGETMKAAAAMCVEVGSFADPDECGGLAHFLEHMVFMGSEKYPTENHYDAFITAHGGFCNAMTEGEYTCFEFDVTAQYFVQSLDIFANCFISPLLLSECSDREINAIENEFNLARNDDAVRLQQLYCHAARQGHIFRKFSWGNMKSLMDDPESKGIDIFPILHQFCTLHYKPQNMKLVVLAPFSLDKIQLIVEKCFGSWTMDISTELNSQQYSKQPRGIKTNRAHVAKRSKSDRSCKCGPKLVGSGAGIRASSKRSKPGAGWSQQLAGGSVFADRKSKASNRIVLGTWQSILEPHKGQSPLEESTLGFFTRVVPIRNVHQVSVSWVIDPQQHEYRAKNSLYVSHLIGHEGPGSLLSALKDNMLATGVSAGIPDDYIGSNSLFSSLWVTITLTARGAANWPIVVQYLYAYLARLREAGPQEWIHAEIKRMAEVDYSFLDEEEESEFAVRLACSMRSGLAVDRKNLLPSAFLVWDWDPQGITRLLDKLVPLNGKVYLTSAAYKIGCSPYPTGDDNDSDDDDEEGDDDDDGSSGSGGGRVAVKGHSKENGGRDDGEEEEEDDADWEDEDSDDEDDDGDDEEEEDEDDQDNGSGALENTSLTVDDILGLFECPLDWLGLVLPPAAPQPPQASDQIPSSHESLVLPNIRIPQTDAVVLLPPPPPLTITIAAAAAAASGGGAGDLSSSHFTLSSNCDTDGDNIVAAKVDMLRRMANELTVVQPLVEPHFGTYHWNDPIPPSVFALWTQPYPTQSSTIAAERATGVIDTPATAMTADESPETHEKAESVLVHTVESLRARLDWAHMTLPPQNLFMPTSLELVPELTEAVRLHAEKEATSHASDVERKLEKGEGKTGAETGKTAKLECNEGEDNAEGEFISESSAWTFPGCLLCEDGLSVWYMPDPRFPQPKTVINIRLCSATAIARGTMTPGTAAAWAVHHDLLTRLVSDSLTEVAYMAAMAELSLNVSNSDAGITICVEGFSDKACLLAQQALSALFDPSKAATSDRFQRQREILLRKYSNDGLKAENAARSARLLAVKPTKVSSADRLTYLQATFSDDVATVSAEVRARNDSAVASVECVQPGEDEKQEKGEQESVVVIERLSCATVVSYAGRFLSTCCVDVLVQGNTSSTQALELAQVLKQLCSQLQSTAVITETAPSSPTPSSAAVNAAPRESTGFSDAFIPVEDILTLPIDQAVVLAVAPLNRDERNICVETYFQWLTPQPPLVRGRCVAEGEGTELLLVTTQLELLEQLLTEPFFDNLRTKQQLGYTVSCSARQTWGMPGFTFTVVSASHSVETVQSAILEFIKAAPELIAGMPVKEFIDHKRSLVSAKLKPDTSLYESAGSSWSAMDDRRNWFSFALDQARLLQSSGETQFTRENMSEFCREVLLGPNRRLLVVQASVDGSCVSVSDGQLGVPCVSAVCAGDVHKIVRERG